MVLVYHILAGVSFNGMSVNRLQIHSPPALLHLHPALDSSPHVPASVMGNLSTASGTRQACRQFDALVKLATLPGIVPLLHLSPEPCPQSCPLACQAYCRTYGCAYCKGGGGSTAVPTTVPTATNWQPC